MEYERYTVFLPDAAVAGNAILIEDRPDVTAEADPMVRPLVKQVPTGRGRQSTSNQKDCNAGNNYFLTIKHASLGIKQRQK